MITKFDKNIKKLWDLTGEIGTLAESDSRYVKVYEKMSEALDEAELFGLIQSTEETTEDETA